MSEAHAMSDQIIALLNRARTGLLAACMEPASERHKADEGYLFWQGYAKALRDLQRGIGDKLADKDEGLKGYETPGALQAASSCLRDDIYRLSRIEAVDRLTTAGLQLPDDPIADFDVGATRKLENDIVSAIDRHGEHAAPLIDDLDRAHGHGDASVVEGLIVSPLVSPHTNAGGER